MNASPVAYRYASALMQLARDRGDLEAVREDMELVATTCASNHDLVLLLNSPVVKADKKHIILGRIFAGNVGQVTDRFIGILVRKGREGMLPDIAQAFQDLYRKDQNILVAEVKSAIPLSDEARARVLAMARERHPGMTIQLLETVDPSLIGGLIIRIGDEQVDASVSRRLNDLRRKFSENPYIPEI